MNAMPRQIYFRWSRGFSLVELLVTISILALVTSVVLIRFNAFDSVVLLKNVGYEIALAIREAQVFAVSAGGDSTGDFNSPYGIHISGNQYTLFIDNGNFSFDASEDQIVRVDTISDDFVISDICAGSTCGLLQATITFQRPEFDAIFDVPGVSNPPTVEIQLQVAGSADVMVAVEVGISGYVTVETN